MNFSPQPTFKQRTLGSRLRQELNSLSRELETKSTQFLKAYDLTPTRLDILEELLMSDGNMTQAQLARLLKMKPANVLMALKPLLARNWIERHASQNNRKVRYLRLSPAHLPEVHKVIQLHDAFLDTHILPHIEAVEVVNLISRAHSSISAPLKD